MATPVDPDDRAAIDALASFGFWEQAGLIESHRFQELLMQRECLDALTKLNHLPHEAGQRPDASPLTQIESELTEDILTLFDDQGLTREQTLSLLGQVSVLVELVRQGQAQSR